MRTPHRRLAAAAALATAASLALVGCGTDTSTPESPTSSQTTTAGSSPAALAQTLRGDEATAEDTTAGRVTDTSPKSALVDQQAPPRLTVTEIRVGEHRGEDRVVFELAGSGTPGYTVEYVAAPAQQGSGNPVEVPGDSFLQVTIDGQALPTETGVTEVAVGTVSGDEAPGVAGVAFAGQFEGRAQAVIGLDGTDRAFSAFLLQDPTRLVVDIGR